MLPGNVAMGLDWASQEATSTCHHAGFHQGRPKTAEIGGAVIIPAAKLKTIIIEDEGNLCRSGCLW